MPQENDIIAGSIIYKDPQDNSREVLDFQLSDEPTSTGGRQFEINYRNKFKMTSLSSRKTKVSTPEGLIEIIKSELKTKGLEYVDTKTVPRKFKFEDQKTTDMLLSGKKLSEHQQQNHFYQANGEYSEDKEYFTLGYRKFAPAGWAFFGGMVEPNQDAWENMTEELKEEAQQNLEDLTTTELGEFHKREVRGTCITTAYSQESKDLSTVQAGDDIEDVLFLDRQGLEHFLKNNKAQMVPHHFELMEELTAQGKLPNFIREAVIANNPSLDQGVVPDNLQSLLETTTPLSIQALLTNSGQSVSILLDETTTKSGFSGSFTQTKSITFPAAEFEDIFGCLPEPLTADQTKMIEARRVSGGAEEIITDAHQQFKTTNPKETKTMNPNTQEEILQLIKDNQGAIDAVTEVFEKTEVPVTPITHHHINKLGKLDNAKYTEAYQAGKWTSLQKDSKDMYPIGGSEDWPSIDEIKANPTEEFYIVKGLEGKDGGAYLCMNDKGGEVYIIQKDENGNPESYQPTLSFAANLQQLQDKKDASVSADSSVSASGKKSTTRSK